MPIIATYKKREYSTAPEGLWSAVCADVVDLGVIKSQWGEQHKIELRWILDDKDPGKDPKTDKAYMVVQRYTLSLHEKSRLRPMLEAWRGKKFTTEELEAFDLEKLIGIPCQLQVIHNAGDEGTTYANVQAVVPAARNGTKMRVPVDYVRVSEREKRQELERQGNGHGVEVQDEDIPF